ncbi:MAG: LacI family DNA-binding transcriptional regulator [Phycisphaeraceae bacterium]|nr:LacI family DNA-binding transcriptional regulator [Phycisphaeraceae bacterium]
MRSAPPRKTPVAGSPVTIYDIARRLGTSHSTVSRALRDHPRISCEMRHRVQLTARELGYQPNLLARSLIQGKSKTIGFLGCMLHYEIAAAKADRLDRLFRAAGYALYFSGGVGEHQPTMAAARDLIARGVDGLLLYGCTGFSPRELAAYRQLSVPVVFFDGPLASPCLQVLLDRASGVEQAALRLLEQGHRRIYMTFSRDRWRQPAARVAGFVRACRRYGLTDTLDRVVPPDTLIAEGGESSQTDPVETALEVFFQRYPDCTALIVSNDLWAMAAVSVLESRGLRVPQDVSIVGFDDVEAARRFRPRLSTVRQPVDLIVQAAFDLMTEAIEQPGMAPKTIRIPSIFVERQSTGPATRRRSSST